MCVYIIWTCACIFICTAVCLRIHVHDSSCSHDNYDETASLKPLPFLKMSVVCSICQVHSLELRPWGGQGEKLSCSLCRTLDRLRGLVSRCDPSFSSDALNLLRDTESRLWDWISFREPPGGSYARETDSSKDAPENLASTFKSPTSKAKPSKESNPGRYPPIPSSGTKKVRKKANKGQERVIWQYQRHLIGRARHNLSPRSRRDPGVRTDVGLLLLEFVWVSQSDASTQVNSSSSFRPYLRLLF